MNNYKIIPVSFLSEIASTIKTRTNTTSPQKVNEFSEKISTMPKSVGIADFLNGDINRFAGSLSYINNNFFEQNPCLEIVVLNGISTIPSSTFISCANLKYINLPECTYINQSAFANCENLKTVILPNCSVLQDNAFLNCPNLTSLFLGYNGVCSIGANQLKSTKIATSIDEGFIYVPYSLISRYKGTLYWATYSNKFKPIEEDL